MVQPFDKSKAQEQLKQLPGRLVESQGSWVRVHIGERGPRPCCGYRKQPTQHLDFIGQLYPAREYDVCAYCKARRPHDDSWLVVRCYCHGDQYNVLLNEVIEIVPTPASPEEQWKNTNEQKRPWYKRIVP